MTAVIAEGSTDQNVQVAFTNAERPKVPHTLRFRSSSDNLSVEYQYIHGTVVTFWFDNNNNYYNPYDGITLSGAVNDTIYDGHRSFTVTMDGDKTITLTPTGYSEWGNVITSSLNLSPSPVANGSGNYAGGAAARIVSAPDHALTAEDSGTGLIPVKVTIPGPARVQRAKAPDSTAKTGQAYTPPAPSAPAGYAEDPDFAAIESERLNSANGWDYEFPPQPKYAPDGQPYYYYVVEKEWSPEEYVIGSYSAIHGIDADGTITVTNLAGSLKIRKSVTVNGQQTTQNNASLTNGTFTFTVAGGDPQVTKTVCITFEGGEAVSATVDGTEVPVTNGIVEVKRLKPGTYTVAEDTDALAASGFAPVGSSSRTVEVGVGESAVIPVAEFTNNKDVGNLVVEKNVSGTNDGTKSFTFDIELQHGTAAVDGAYTAVRTKADGTVDSEVTSVRFTGGKATVVLKAGEKIRILNLPAGTAYTVTEQTPPAGYAPAAHTGNSGTIGTGTDSAATMNNTYSATGTLDFSAKKVFTHGTLGDPEFAFRLTQVTGESSTTPATAEDIGTGEGKIPALKLPTAVTKETAANSGTTETVTFPTIGFGKNSDADETGEYWFLLEEVLPEGVTPENPVKDGVRYDTLKKWIRVTVADDGAGNLTVSKAPSTETGSPDGTWTNEQLGSLEITKEIRVTGGRPEQEGFPAGEYAYGVRIATLIGGETYYVQDTSGTLSTQVATLQVTASQLNTPGPILTVNNLPFGTYTVTEASQASVAGYSFVERLTNPQGAIQVQSVTTGDGEVNETAGRVDLINYYMRGASWTPEAEKYLNGVPHSAGASGYDGYSFTLAEPQGQNTIHVHGQPGVHTVTRTTEENGKAVFDAIEYHLPPHEHTATYRYTITENRPAAAQADPYIADHVQYDPKTVYVEVMVTRTGNGANMVTEASARYYSDASYGEEYELDGTAFFDNTELGSLKIRKTVSNQTETDVSDQQFTFNVTLTKPNHMEADEFSRSCPTVTVPSGGTAVEGSRNIASGTVFTVTLNAGDTWEIGNLPIGTGYSITEDALPAGWTQTSPGGAAVGTIGAKGETYEAAFINVYSEAADAPQVTKP